MILPFQPGESETRACTAKTNRICQDTSIPVLTLRGGADTDVAAGMGAFEIAAQGAHVYMLSCRVCVH